jgi:hypothetical protein
MAPLSGYNLPSPDANDPLTDPPHATLHSSVNNAVNDLDRRVATIEDAAPDAAENVRQARLAAHTWMVRGALTQGLQDTLLVPVLWNLTGRTVEYAAAKVTVELAADADLIVDIVTGADLSGNAYSPDLHTSILKGGPMTVPAGEYVSPSVAADGFVSTMAQETYIAAVITAMGSSDAPGGSITVQIDRLL